MAGKMAAILDGVMGPKQCYTHNAYLILLRVIIACSTKFLREFSSADGRVFAFLGNRFLRLGKTVFFSRWGLIFAIFRKLRCLRSIKFSFLC